MKLDWDQLRYFLAVIEHGSTKRAAAALQVDQTTCARRITALETSLGLELFARDSGRYLPTQDALELVPSAKAMQAAAGAFSEQADSRKRARGRRIRISTDEVLTHAIVIPAAERLSQLYPEVQIEMDVSQRRRDLQAGEADIAIRGGLEPNDPGIVRRKLADDPLGFYCSWSYPSPPMSRSELADHPLACLDLLRERFEGAGLAANLKHVVNSLGALRAIVSDGNVVGVLPASLAETPPPLRLCFLSDAPTALWLVYAERVRHIPEVREFGRLLAAEFRRFRQNNGEQKADRLPVETI